ncbi:sodium/sugar symporter [Chitinophaga sp. MM2321]|uniref:sodium/sugar symporter n=1 Tax=Chitinophaga sp. MM2321 TaxID=3137178 RepID=UPI0032D59A92
MSISTIDFLVICTYSLIIVIVGLYVSRKKKGHETTSQDYFLAGKTLTWWAIGTSIIASNISAEQFVGMSGSGYVIGLGIASYEWMGGLTLIVVAKYFIPIYLKKGIYTMPQFLQSRFDNRVRTSLAVFWVVLYIFVNLTAVLYLGALFLSTVLNVGLMHCIIGLALFSAIYSIYGGLMAVAWTDVIHVTFMIIGGLLTTIFALDAVSNGNGIIAGFQQVLAVAPEKFHMILPKDNPHYDLLPGISVLIGGMWVLNLAYFGCNQYITQRALAAKDLKEAQKGMLFAGFLKILLPVIVVLPGIIAFVLKSDMVKPDGAYPWIINQFLPTGAKGIVIAAMIGAIVSSLSSMGNSASTIFTMDIYINYLNPKASEKKLVLVGRISAVVSLMIAVVLARPLLGDLDQAFQFIQEYTGFISPAIIAIFGFGLFWKRATSNAVLWAAIAAIPLSVMLKVFLPQLPFMNRVLVVFLILSAIIVVISRIESKGPADKAIDIKRSMFYTSRQFNLGAIILSIILAALYLFFW